MIDNNDAFALIPARYQTVATIFKKAGYAMAAIGKWHLGLGDRGGIDWNKPILHTPNDIGFDESFIMPATSDRVPYEVAPARDTQPHWASWVGKDKKGRTYAVQEGLRNVLVVLKGKYKYIDPTAQTMKRAWETGIETGFEGAPQLYHLSVDPAERHNIAGRQPALVKEFEAVIRGERGRH
ncbi:hypothetical protein [Capnocytophaga sputigena]